MVVGCGLGLGVFRLPFVGRLLMNKAACVEKRRCEAKIKMERRLIAKWCVQLGLKGCQDVDESPTRQRLQVWQRWQPEIE